MNEIDEVMNMTVEELDQAPAKLDTLIKYITRLYQMKMSGAKLTKEPPPDVSIHDVLPDFIKKPTSMVKRRFT